MFQFKETLITGLAKRMKHVPLFGSINYYEVEIGFFMFQRPDTNKVIYQSSLGDYREVLADNIHSLSEKHLVDTLEKRIVAGYGKHIKQTQDIMDSELQEVDRLISKKSEYRQQMYDLDCKRGIDTPLTENQTKSYSNLTKATKRVTKRLHSHERKADQYREKLELLKLGQETSVEEMKRLINSLNS